MFENLKQHYQKAKEKRRNLKEAKRQLDENISRVKQCTQAFDETITRIRQELDQKSHVATTRKTLDQSWRKALKSRDTALSTLITQLEDLQKTYDAYQNQGGSKRYDVEDLLDVRQYQYSDNVHGLVTELELIGQIVANMEKNEH